MLIARGGQVLAAGASAPEAEAAETLDCVTEAVREWIFPDPGSYPAKASFALANDGHGR